MQLATFNAKYKLNFDYIDLANQGNFCFNVKNFRDMNFWRHFNFTVFFKEFRVLRHFEFAVQLKTISRVILISLLLYKKN